MCTLGEIKRGSAEKYALENIGDCTNPQLDREQAVKMEIALLFLPFLFNNNYVSKTLHPKLLTCLGSTACQIFTKHTKYGLCAYLYSKPTSKAVLKNNRVLCFALCLSVRFERRHRQQHILSYKRHQVQIQSTFFKRRRVQKLILLKVGVVCI